MTERTEFSPDEIKAIRTEILTPKNREPTDSEVLLFVHHCLRTKLDPFDRQIYGAYRWNNQQGRERLQVQATIDGFRVVAERSGKYLGQEGPYWCGPDAVWFDVWVDDSTPPIAAKVGVKKAGADTPTFAVAKFSEYAQKTKTGGLMGLWGKMPSNQLAKCAEALALRKAFPHDLSGIYTTEEMQQADVDADATDITNQRALPKPEADTNSKPPTPATEPVTRKAADTASKGEVDALRELIEITKTAEPFVRMTLIDFGIDDVGTLDEMLPKLTVGQALHVMAKINERQAA